MIRRSDAAEKGDRLRLVGTVALVAAVVGMAGIFIPPAEARVGGTPINGRFLVTSNGQMAKTNEVFHDEQTVSQIWTITSTCVDSTECTGHISSSQGWDSALGYDGAWWSVDHLITNWQPCQDGTFGPGLQRFRFWGVSDTGMTDDTNTTLLVGNDTTFGDSGSCGINKVLVIDLPVRLQRIDQ